MWKVSEMRLNGDDVQFMYLHAFDRKRDAQAFAARWQAANPGRWTRVVKIGA